MLKNLQQIPLKLLQKQSFKKKKKKAEATGALIGNKVPNKITRVSKDSQQNSSEIVTNEYDKKIRKDRYVSQEKRQGIIDKLRLKQYKNEISKSPKSSKKFATK